MHHVAILIYDHVALFELGCAVELFGLNRPEFDNWYTCDIVSFKPGAHISTAGIKLTGRHVKCLDPYDTLIIPSWPPQDADIPDIIRSEVQKFNENKKRILSFCSGAFLLAALRIFDKGKATTHWRYAEIFKKRFPHIEFVPDVLYRYDGRIGCSAGSSSAIDLGLEVIRSDFGYERANQVARRLVLSAHRKGGQAQFAEKPVQEAPGQFAKALDWALKHLSLPIAIDSFAKKAHMSRRTFDRKFRENLNLTPKAWLTHQRLNLARELLEKEKYSIETVAERSGFTNATTMRHHFRKELGISPSMHREQFNASIVSVMKTEKIDHKKG